MKHLSWHKPKLSRTNWTNWAWLNVLNFELDVTCKDTNITKGATIKSHASPGVNWYCPRIPTSVWTELGEDVAGSFDLKAGSCGSCGSWNQGLSGNCKRRQTISNDILSLKGRHDSHHIDMFGFGGPHLDKSDKLCIALSLKKMTDGDLPPATCRSKSFVWLLIVSGSDGMHQDLMAELGDKSWRLGSLAASATSETVEYVPKVCRAGLE